MAGSDTVHSVPKEYYDFVSSDDSDKNATHRLTIIRNGQPRRTRQFIAITGFGPNHTLGVYNNNVDSVERALLERYFLCAVDGTYKRPPTICEDAYKTPLLAKFRAAVVASVRLTATVINKYQVRDCYTGAKWRIYDAALKSLLSRRLSPADSRLRPFTKFEKQCLRKACRIINPRTPRYNLVLGKYLKKNEKLYYKAINDAWGAHTDHTVIKGMDVVAVATCFRQKWGRFKRPVAIGLDASKFDMHVSVFALLYEHGFYNGVFISPELAKLLKQQLDNKGIAFCDDGIVKFRMPGTRCSGDLNTSLGNCIIMCSLIWELVQLLLIDAELANNGDDCVVIMEQENLEKFMRMVPGFFLSKGFRMTVEAPVYEFEKIEFCQSNPVFDGVNWRMMRNVVACMKKDAICLQSINNEKSLKKWLGAVGECGLSLVPGLPVVRNMYQSLLRSGTSASKRFKQHIFKNTGMMERMGSTKYEDRPPCAESRASFYRATGITPDLQLEYEKYYDSLNIDTKIKVTGALEVENAPIPCIALAPVIFYNE